MLHRAMMNVWYRYGTPPWVMGPREELVELVESGRLRPGRAIDLGCGSGDNAIFLAQHGFDVTGVDFAHAAIDKAREKAATAGVEVRFVVGDLTDLRGVEGPFDLLVDYGTWDDLSAVNREAYVDNVLPLAAPDAAFLLFCFEWEARWWERLVSVFFGATGMVPPGAVDAHFAERFSIEELRRWRGKGIILETATYLMSRKQPDAAA